MAMENAVVMTSIPHLDFPCRHAGPGPLGSAPPVAPSVGHLDGVACALLWAGRRGAVVVVRDDCTRATAAVTPVLRCQDLASVFRVTCCSILAVVAETCGVAAV